MPAVSWSRSFDGCQRAAMGIRYVNFHHTGGCTFHIEDVQALGVYNTLQSLGFLNQTARRLVGVGFSVGLCNAGPTGRHRLAQTLPSQGYLLGFFAGARSTFRRSRTAIAGQSRHEHGATMPQLLQLPPRPDPLKHFAKEHFTVKLLALVLVVLWDWGKTALWVGFPSAAGWAAAKYLV